MRSKLVNKNRTPLRIVSFHPVDYNREGISGCLCRAARKDINFFQHFRVAAESFQENTCCEQSFRKLSDFVDFVMAWNILQISWNAETGSVTFYFRPVSFPGYGHFKVD